MKHRLLGFFSGFPSRRFPPEIAERLSGALAKRDCLVFVSAWPEDYERNDSDAAGMHGMFAEYGMAFERYCVIDRRMEAPQAVEAIREASCIFLMGGFPRLQRQLLRDLGLDAEIQASDAVVLGVSAGAINMAARSLDTKESPVPYPGLGLADVTVKPPFRPEDGRLLAALLRISRDEKLPICAMEDGSAIFVEGGCASWTGKIRWIDESRHE